MKLLHLAVLDLHFETHLRVAHEVAVLFSVVTDGEGRETVWAGSDVLDGEGSCGSLSIVTVALIWLTSSGLKVVR